jgi:hypothetical protein
MKTSLILEKIVYALALIIYLWNNNYLSLDMLSKINFSSY